MSKPWQDIVSDILVERCTFQNPLGRGDTFVLPHVPALSAKVIRLVK